MVSYYPLVSKYYLHINNWTKSTSYTIFILCNVYNWYIITASRYYGDVILKELFVNIFLIIIIIESFFEVTAKKKQTQKKTKYRAQAFSARPWFTATTH